MCPPVDFRKIDNHEHGTNEVEMRRDHACIEELLNPTAVSVKWFKCTLCGRSRSEVVNKDIW